MDENRDEFAAGSSSEAPKERKPYRTPTLHRLGDIQSVVQSNGNTGGDGGNSSS